MTLPDKTLLQQFYSQIFSHNNEDIFTKFNTPLKKASITPYLNVKEFFYFSTSPLVYLGLTAALGVVGILSIFITLFDLGTAFKNFIFSTSQDYNKDLELAKNHGIATICILSGTFLLAISSLIAIPLLMVSTVTRAVSTLIDKTSNFLHKKEEPATIALDNINFLNVNIVAFISIVSLPMLFVNATTSSIKNIAQTSMNFFNKKEHLSESTTEPPQAMSPN